MARCGTSAIRCDSRRRPVRNVACAPLLGQHKPRGAPRVRAGRRGDPGPGGRGCHPGHRLNQTSTADQPAERNRLARAVKPIYDAHPAAAPRRRRGSRNAAQASCRRSCRARIPAGGLATSGGLEHRGGWHEPAASRTLIHSSRGRLANASAEGRSDPRGLGEALLVWWPARDRPHRSGRPDCPAQRRVELVLDRHDRQVSAGLRRGTPPARGPVQDLVAGCWPAWPRTRPAAGRSGRGRPRASTIQVLRSRAGARSAPSTPITAKSDAPRSATGIGALSPGGWPGCPEQENGPGDGQHVVVVSRRPGEGPGMPPAAHRQVDDVPPPPGRCPRIRPPPSRPHRDETLHEHVGPGGEREQEVEVAAAAQVEERRCLAPGFSAEYIAGTRRRRGSPAGGRSTLTTVAPSCARSGSRRAPAASR